MIISRQNLLENQKLDRITNILIAGDLLVKSADIRAVYEEKIEPIMIDFGSVLNGYHMDETRMFAIDSMPDRAMKACHAAIEIHNRILDEVKPGVTCCDLFQISISKAKSLGYSEQYLGPPGHKVAFIGHGVGLELIEPPIISQGTEDHLEAGMVFALEPKMVFQNEFSVGIESVFLVTETGYRLISQIPAKVFIC